MEAVFDAYKRITPISKSFCAIILTFYFLSFIVDASHVLAITPGYLMPPGYYVWTLVTFIFFDDHFYCVLIDLITIFFSNTLLEPLWGQKQLIQFLLIVTVSSGLVCFFICYFLYICTFNPNYIFFSHIHGMISYTAAVTVAARQTLPDDVVVTLPFAVVKNQHLSFLCLIISIVMALIRIVEFIYPCLFASGIVISWVYLRFYQKHENGIQGDTSESFEFARFFPRQLAPPVAVAGNFLFALLVRLRLCRRHERQVRATPLAGVVVRDPDESERRKQLALKALNERLSAASQEPWPSVADGKEEAKAPEPEAPPAQQQSQEASLSEKELQSLPVPEFAQSE